MNAMSGRCARLAVSICVLCAGCTSGVVQHEGAAQNSIPDGNVGRSDAAPTLHVSGTVDATLAPTLFVEYVATRDAAECTRVDGESGRVVHTKWLRYPVQANGGRYEVDVLLDPLDGVGCGFVPRTLYGSAKNLNNGRATDAYVPWLAFTLSKDQGRAQLAEQTINCQDSAAQSTVLDCSLPLERLADERQCTTERVLRCGEGCSAVFHVVFIDPPRADAMWASPKGCPGPS